MAISRAVFLSYASEDSEAAQRIADALTAAGIEVWFDRSELRSGDAWDHKIRQQIQDCVLFMPLVSRATEARLEGYFRREWHLAADRMLDMADGRAFLVPVVVDDTRERGAQTPDSFRRVQWTRLAGGETSPAFVARIAALLAATGPGSAAQASSHAGEAGATRPAVRMRWTGRAAAGAIALAAVAIAATGWLLARHYSAGPRTTAVAAADKSIVVLPFADMSEKHDQEYFSDGMAEELIDRLAQIPQLRVISRTSAFRFKGNGEDVAAIGQKLSVANVLEGSVRRSGDRLRIDVKLLSVADGAQRWSQRYDRPISDVFRVQDEIASEVVLALKARLLESSALDQALTRSDAAHNLLLEGRFLVERSGPGDAERAISKYQQALNEDPDYALAWAELAWAQIWTTPQNYAGCASAARHAVEVGPNLASAHATRGWCESLLGFDWALGDEEFDKALALEPNNARAVYGKGRLARALGKTSDALRYYQAVLEWDPINPSALGGLAFTLVAAKRPAEAVQQARRMLDLSPNARWGHYYLAYALLWNGELEEALRASTLEPVASMRSSCQALIAHVRGDRQAEDAALRALLASDDPYRPYFAAQVYAARGDSKAAIDWLERARLARIGWFSEFNSDPAFD
ncbi:MAG TPA: TIR domain-containing protein, partial [Steroidobacteraceae bacterium]|nr:TIR domain-containing protein [Steroidobacteraceae bacterium]